MFKFSFIFVKIKFKIMKYTKEYWEWNNSQDDMLLKANPDLIFQLPKVETTTCKVLVVNPSNYKTDQGYISKNYCFCNPATTIVGDTIKVRTNFLENYD